MPCEICGMIGGHHSRCPNYMSPKSNHRCSICKKPILNGEVYIVVDGRYAHDDCFYNLSEKDLFDWLDIQKQTMEGDDY